jgi:hypothetical protein
MAKKRESIKWVRDLAKSAYEKQPCCYICDVTENLELHHTNGMQNMWEAWIRKNGYSDDTDEQVKELRQQFIDEHHHQIYIEVFTLCKSHHRKLHSVYGKSPPLSTAKKQVKWVELQKAKFNGTAPVNTDSPFSKFIK